MRRTVIVILDGLRRDMMTEAHTPRLADFARRSARFVNHRSVFPSTTRVSAASIATGCHPGRHELLGNTLALVQDGELVLHDAGHPDFFQRKRELTGRTLAVPTLAERLKDAGGSIAFSNVSPGAAYALDPDGYGYVYHSAGSYGPGRRAVAEPDELRVDRDLAGDKAMTERFVEEVLQSRRPALALIWLGHPDTTQHAVPLGSPRHIEALAAADRHAGLVIDCVERLQAAGDDILLLVGSDHGHQTVTGVIDIEAELITAGLKSNHASKDVVVAANGTAALVYLASEHQHLSNEIAAFLTERPWLDRLIPNSELASVGLTPQQGLAIAVSMRSSPDVNAYGVPGGSLIAVAQQGKNIPVGYGQHGGLGEHEQAPVLLVQGGGLASRATHRTETSLVDIAPTVLTHLGLSAEDMDGRKLQCFTNGQSEPGH